MILIAPETLQIFMQIEDGIAATCARQLLAGNNTPERRQLLHRTRTLAQCRAEMLGHMAAAAREAGFE